MTTEGRTHPVAGQVAVVTGAASGIGLALSERLVADGLRVVMADVEEEPLLEHGARLARSGEVHTQVTDVSEEGAVDALRDATLAAFGGVDIVCNNAGVGGGGVMWELSTADWEWVLGVNLWGVIHGIRAFVPLLVDQGHGHVVNTASVAGIASAPGMGPYNASKHAVVTLSETLRAELEMGSAGVGVSVLCPGWVNTRIVDSERNRPGHLSSPATDAPATDSAATVDDDARSAMQAEIAAMVGSGMAPSDVAQIVVDGIADNRLYLFTHDMWMDLARNRLENLLDEARPDAAAPPD